VLVYLNLKGSYTMLSVGQKVKVSEMPYGPQKSGFVTYVFTTSPSNNSYMVASDKTLPRHYSDPKKGEYHLFFWEEGLESIK
jgi:hypothetical protein